MSDLGSGIEKGLAEFSKWLHQLGEIQKEADLLKGDCFAHFMQNQFPKLRRSASSLVFFNQAKQGVIKLAELPSSLVGRVWQGIKAQWKSLGETKFIDKIESKYFSDGIRINFGVFDDALGVPRVSNHLEKYNDIVERELLRLGRLKDPLISYHCRS